MTNRTKVLIAGAGPVGLTAALLLGSKGIPVIVLEAQDAISEELRASTFHPPTLDMMAPYGVTARMMEAGLLCPTWQIRLRPSGDRAVFDLPVPQGETAHPYRLHSEQALEDKAQQELLHDIVPDAGRIEVLETRPYRIHKRLASTYRKGRVLLAGDAAHLNSPSGGMGMNGGIHDAFSLCEKLIAVIQERADPRILDRYERQRRPIAEEEIIQQSHRNRTRMQERDPARRRAMLEDFQRITEDSVKLKAHLMKSSMIDGLRRAAATA